MTVVSTPQPGGPVEGGSAAERPSTGVLPRHAANRARPPSAAAYIPELHGLRGLALALVVAFHLFGNGRVSGGVDVFLVLSGFLATGSLLRRAERRELRLGDHYGRTFSRLVPPALIVLAATAVLTVLFLPRGIWLQTGKEILASALYYVNWEMISGQLVYGAAGPQTSPLQHFWSMSVQGQFFLAWPVVVLLLVALARLVRISPRALLLVVVGTTTVASFLYASALHGVDQPVAYFHTAARFWELGIGGFLALLIHTLRVPGGLRPVLAWAGLGLVVSSGFLLDGGALFPGEWALWPVTGALLVLVGSGGESSWGPRALLEVRPLRFVADISYALYLWHWPLLIAYLHYSDLDRVDWKGAALILSTSVLLSWLTMKLVADPVQRFRVRFGGVRALVAAAVCVAVAAGGTVVGLNLIERQDAQLLAAAEEAAEAAEDDGPNPYPGALALSRDYQETSPGDMPVLPAPAVAAKDRPSIDGDGCIEGNSVTSTSEIPLTCVLNDAESPERLVVLVGDSHSIQWAPPMTEIGAEENWQVLLLARRGCRLAAPPPGEQVDLTNMCWRWRVNALDLLEQLRPDAVMVVGSRTSPTETGDTAAPAEVRAWARLAESGLRVVTLRDTPRFGFDVPACVEEETGGVGCTRASTEVYSPVNPVRKAAGAPKSAVHLDLTRFICEETLCGGVVGNVLIYRDDNHMTATYARSLTRPLHQALQTRADWLFVGPSHKDPMREDAMHQPPVRQRF